jgi:hypothetical protein
MDHHRARLRRIENKVDTLWIHLKGVVSQTDNTPKRANSTRQSS